MEAIIASSHEPKNNLGKKFVNRIDRKAKKEMERDYTGNYALLIALLVEELDDECS